MSELVIGGVLFGVAYLLSNQDPQPEGMTNIETDTTFKNNQLKSKLNMKYTDSTTSHQKHMTTRNTQMTHNNMTPFYKNKSNGHQFEDTAIDSILDHHTGGGSNAIEKQEKSAFFKPTDNMQNVYGNKSNSDFMQSRVNSSSKYGNTKPWEEIQESPGSMGFNNAYQYREDTKDKTVNDLRTLNNPKVSYENNYKSPAYKPKDYNPQALGKVAHKKPDTYHVNNNIEAFGAPRGNIRTVAKPQQMMTNEHREDTSVSYFGVKGTNNNTTYTKPSENVEVHKVQLPATQLSNLSGNGIHPQQSHGREGFSAMTNNRTVNNMGDYFGNVKNNLYSNIVSPIVNTIRPTKKGETIHNKHMGNINNSVINPTPHTKNDLPTTNREMNPHSLNHMNVQNQSSDGYKVSNPYVIGTQRNTTSHSHIGGAKGVNLISNSSPSYSPMIDKTVEERAPSGNTNMFNNKINVNLQSREKENTRQSAIYNPNDIQMVGDNTRITQEYENKQSIDDSMVQAFKNNPYTHSLSSVA